MMANTRSSTEPARPRSPLRAVAVPSEHGGWGLTAEPIMLGLLLAPSIAGVLLGLAGVLAFLARTPLKIVLVDASRHRSMDRTALARCVVAVELVVVLALVVGAFVTASTAFWIPALVAAPLVGLELWFDMRSRSRRLAPELAGSVGIASLAAIIVIAGDGSATLAVGAWLVLAARSITSIPFVRRQVAALHGRVIDAWTIVVSDIVAVIVAVAAVVVDRDLLDGAVAVVAVIALQRATARLPVSRAAVIGIRQMVLGFAVVLVTWIGVVASGGGT